MFRISMNAMYEFNTLFYNDSDDNVDNDKTMVAGLRSTFTRQMMVIKRWCPEGWLDAV